MFNKLRPDITNNPHDTIIGPTVNVEGDLVSDGIITIEGNVKGTIKTSNAVQIAPSARIHASLQAKNARIAGMVTGDINILEDIEIISTAQIKGNISCITISIEKGALVNGSITCRKDAGVPIEKSK